MTARKFKSSLDPMYSRARSEARCTHAPEAHVRYDREAAAYRAGYYCSCGKVAATSTRIHTDPTKADREAITMLARRQSDIARKRRDRVEARETKRRTMPAVVVPRSAALAATPPPTLDQAWILYWRGLCARHGHESRLR